MSLSDPLSLFSLEGRVVVVTGASSGIGRDLARGLAAVGARVVVAARRAQRLDALVAEIADAGGDALAVACDVTREADVDRLLATTLAERGRVDGLVNNAGITEVVAAEDEPVGSWQRVLDVNLNAVFLTCQRFGRQMLAQGSGNIVNVASILGLVGTGQIPQASYSASKGAVVNLTRELAAQWARKGVRVNAIAPGWFETEMTGDTWQDEGYQRWMRSRAPMGRTGGAHELIGALLYLASDASSFVTGHTLPVDGGWTIV